MNLKGTEDPALIARLNHLIIPPINDPIQIYFYWLKYYDSTELTVGAKKTFHSHPFYEIHFVFGGSEDYLFSETGNMRVGAMNYLVIPPSVAHRELCREGDFRKFTVGFVLQDAARGASETLFSPMNRFFEEDVRIGKIDERITECFRNILHENAHQEFCTAYFIRNELFRLLCTVFRDAPDPVYSWRDADERIRSAKAFIAENLGLPISESDIAQKIGVSIRQISRLFRKYENCTPLQYIHRRKCSEASRLLRDTSMNLQEISEQLGFGSEYYFNTFYKRMTGITPGSYREKIAKS